MDEVSSDPFPFFTLFYLQLFLKRLGLPHFWHNFFKESLGDFALPLDLDLPSCILSSFFCMT